ncbi:hypothetical protein ZYGM_003927 [Zygosaccharomyces mellis]|uniref:Uncharacterized protein n=1 Tax=Zygosaccharomyces mellis TaxID=42258 RepID=A0A4C2E434_9SACH|nr:hypothetical protein ZYGM_003927 [Zygosaccharomyces mellis]
MGHQNVRLYALQGEAALSSFAVSKPLSKLTILSSVMSGAENLYRMLVLLEEPVSGTKPEEEKKVHEFMDELVLPFNVDEIDQLNSWFDRFDEQICIPNEGHIKYEITSDGIIVLILDKEMEPLVSEVRSFVETHRDREDDDDENEED